MATQLEIIKAAIVENGPMTAEELGAVLKSNGSNAERPENSVLRLVSTTPELVNVGGTPPRYGLKSAVNSVRSPKTGTPGPLNGRDWFAAFKALCARLWKDNGNDWSMKEENVKQKMVLPVLRFLGYDDSRKDMDFESDVKGRRADIALVAGKKKIFVELKGRLKELDEPIYRRQLLDYMAHDADCNLGILTNGKEWQFFYEVNAKKPVLVPIHRFMIESVKQADFEILSMFGKDSFDEKRLASIAKESASRRLDAIKAKILSSDDENGYVRFPEKDDVKKLLDTLSDDFDRWRKKEIGL